LSCHDNLIDRQNGACGFGGQLDGPGLRNQEIENARIFGVQDSSVVIVL
jgi:hypothetical protein